MCVCVCVCVCVCLMYGEPRWFSPALASITVDGVDKCNDRVRSSNRQDPARERSMNYCFQRSSRLRSFLRFGELFLIFHACLFQVLASISPSILCGQIRKVREEKRREEELTIALK